jgi:hypothetical protein
MSATISRTDFMGPSMAQVFGRLSAGRLLFAGGAGLLFWELWSRVLAEAALGYPVEPEGLIEALVHHNLGVPLPSQLSLGLHCWAAVIILPVAHRAICRGIRNNGLVLDLTAWSLMTVALATDPDPICGAAPYQPLWTIVTILMATRAFNPSRRLADALSWGTFIGVGALGIAAPLGGLALFQLSEGLPFSLVAFAGYLIYGTASAWLLQASGDASSSHRQMRFSP